MLLKGARERKDVAQVVVDQDDATSLKRRDVLPLDADLLVERNAGDGAMQEQGGLVEEPLGRARVLEDDRRGGLLELLLLGGRDSRPV